MLLQSLTSPAIHVIILTTIFIFVNCEKVHISPEFMREEDDTTILNRFSAFSRGDYLYTSEMKDSLKYRKEVFNISTNCIDDIIQVINDLTTYPPKLYAVQSKSYYVFQDYKTISLLMPIS